MRLGAQRRMKGLRGRRALMQPAQYDRVPVRPDAHDARSPPARRISLVATSKTTLPASRPMDPAARRSGFASSSLASSASPSRIFTSAAPMSASLAGGHSPRTRQPSRRGAQLRPAEVPERLGATASDEAVALKSPPGAVELNAGERRNLLSRLVPVESPSGRLLAAGDELQHRQVHALPGALFCAHRRCLASIALPNAGSPRAAAMPRETGNPAVAGFP
jgi:hypothetical protein